MKDKVIILGNDHTNSLGVVQSLGSVGYYTIIFVWGSKSGLIKSSKYAKEVYGSKDVQACIDLMIEKFGNNSTKLPVIACCDNAALALEKNNKRLKETFLYEYSTKYTLNQLAKKETQVQLAKEAGLYVHHFLSLMHREISFFKWLSEIKKSQGFLTTYTNDRIPFFKQFSNWILYKLHLKKYEIYE